MSGAPDGPTPAGTPVRDPAPPLGAGWLVLAWFVGVITAQVLGTLTSIVVLSALPSQPLVVIGAVSTVAGMVTGLVAALGAVLVFGLPRGRAAGRPLWHWPVVGVPVILVGAVLGLVTSAVVVGQVRLDPLQTGVLVLELVLVAGASAGLGALLSRSAEARARAAGVLPRH